MSRVEQRFQSAGQREIVLETAQRLGFTQEQIQLLKTPYSELRGNHILDRKRGYKSELFCVASICSLDAVGSFRWSTHMEDLYGKIDFWAHLNHGGSYPPIPVQVKTTPKAARDFRRIIRNFNREHEEKKKIVVVSAIPIIRRGKPMPDPVEQVQIKFLEQTQAFLLGS